MCLWYACRHMCCKIWARNQKQWSPFTTLSLPQTRLSEIQKKQKRSVWSVSTTNPIMKHEQTNLHCAAVSERTLSRCLEKCGGHWETVFGEWLCFVHAEQGGSAKGSPVTEVAVCVMLCHDEWAEGTPFINSLSLSLSFALCKLNLLYNPMYLYTAQS